MYYNEKTGNFALVQPNVTESVTDEVTNEITEVIVGLDPDYILIADKPSEDYIYDGIQWVTKPIVLPTLDNAKSAKLEEVKLAYTTSISELVGNVDRFELASWGTQEAEAKAYIVDNTVATPLLSGMVISRGLGETVLQFSNKIVANSNGYSSVYSTILGTYQAKQKAIAVATTVAEVQAI
jgi:hypothetical protein